MLVYLRLMLSVGLCAALAAGLTWPDVSAQVGADGPAFAKRQLSLSASEAKALAAGQPIVKTLEATSKREMTTAGGIRITGQSMNQFVDRFKTLEGFKTSQFILQIARFSDEPQRADLDALVVEPRDIDSLRRCRVGVCELQLAAEDIKRFASEVPWQAPDASARAAALYRSILFSYLQAYRTGGVAKLAQYQDQEQPVRLAGEIAALWSARPSLLERAPEFDAYLRQFPAGHLANTVNFYYWSKEEFGFKPVVGLNHVSVHTTAQGDVALATTQIYASHYIEGQAQTSLVVPDPQGAAPGYLWLFMNRSRVGPLGGLIGTLSRPIVQRRARAGLTRSLVQTKQRLEGRP